MSPYEAVYAAPDGESTVARHAAAAARAGYEGVVVRNWRAATEHVDADYAAAVGEAYGVDVVDAATVATDDVSRARGAIGNLRTDRTLVIVRGGTPAINRFAVESPKVDVLAAPMRGEGDFNHVLARAARDNGVRVEFDLSRVLRTRGGRRVQALRGLRKLRELVDHYDTPHVVSGTPRSHLQGRAPRELRAVGETVGFEAAAIGTGLAEWGRLADRNRTRRSESFIAPGVERRDHEADS